MNSLSFPELSQEIHSTPSDLWGLGMMMIEPHLRLLSNPSLSNHRELQDLIQQEAEDLDQSPMSVDLLRKDVFSIAKNLVQVHPEVRWEIQKARSEITKTKNYALARLGFMSEANMLEQLCRGYDKPNLIASFIQQNLRKKKNSLGK